MKARQFQRIARTALPVDGEWAFSRSLCYRVPARRMVIGVDAQSSRFHTGAYIYRVNAPLFQGDQFGAVDLTWSDRVGGQLEVL